MGLFQRIFNIQDDHVDFKIVQNILAGFQTTFNYPTYLSHVGYTAVSDSFLKIDESARHELNLFLSQFLELDINQIKMKSQKNGYYESSGVDIRLLRDAFVKFVPLAESGKEGNISMLLQQGMELDTEQRSYYIQRSISQILYDAERKYLRTSEGEVHHITISFDYAGSADRKLEEHQVITLSSYLLLKHLIEFLVGQPGKHGATWLKEMSWYFACVFAFWMQYSVENKILSKY